MWVGLDYPKAKYHLRFMTWMVLNEDTMGVILFNWFSPFLDSKDSAIFRLYGGLAEVSAQVVGISLV